MATQNEEFIGYLTGLVEKTRAQQIPWVKANPTTYVASIASANARMSLQKVVRPATPPTIRRVAGMNLPVPGSTGSTSFVFQVMEAATGVAVVNLNAPSTDAAFAVLTELFDSIEDLGKKKGFDLLKKILNSG